MSDFTLLRYQECSRTLVGNLAGQRRWIVFWFCAVLMLLLNLGLNGAVASEGRWLAIAREMLASGDWLHPRINGQAYFDKPLVSYWLICLTSLASGGVVTEMTARAPSALFALVGLYCVIALARRLFTAQTAWIAAWLTLTTFGFVHWGRLAEADMENCIFILMAVTWYFHCRAKPSFWKYLIFWILCSIGAQTKGLAALVIPPSLAALDILFYGAWKRHCTVSAVLAAVLGIAVYFLPFVLEAFSRSGYAANGLILVFRENLVRVFAPWDHNKDPFWIYLVYLPRLLIPWIPFFVLALAENVRRLCKKGEMLLPSEKWLLASIALIFMLFTISKSRRVYYILPILPYCLILTARFLTEVRDGIFQKSTKYLLYALDLLIPVFAFVMVFSSCILRIFVIPRFFPADALYPEWFFPLFDAVFPALGMLLLIFWFVSVIRFHKGNRTFYFLRNYPDFERVLPVVALSFFFVFAVLIPLFGTHPAFRTEKDFYRAARRDYIDRWTIPPERIAFFNRNSADASFYLDLPKSVKVFGYEKNDTSTRDFYDDTCDVLGPEEFHAFVDEIRIKGGIVFYRADDVTNKRFPEDLRPLFRCDAADPASFVVLEAFSLPEQKMWNQAERTDNRKKMISLTKKKKAFRFFPPSIHRTVSVNKTTLQGTKHD